MKVDYRSFRVYGNAVPQGSKNGYVRGNRAILVESGGERLKVWREKVANAGRELGVTVSDDPFYVYVTFIMPRPKYLKDKPAPPMTVMPDTDKLLRAVGDALTKIIWKDDSQIVLFQGYKRRAEPGEEPGALITYTNVDPRTQTIVE